MKPQDTEGSAGSEILPVSLNVHPGDPEAQIGRSSNRNAITSSGEMQQLLLELQRECQHHLPEEPASTNTSGKLSDTFRLDFFFWSFHEERQHHLYVNTLYVFSRHLQDWRGAARRKPFSYLSAPTGGQGTRPSDITVTVASIPETGVCGGDLHPQHGGKDPTFENLSS